jgi:hypothetical protein
VKQFLRGLAHFFIALVALLRLFPTILAKLPQFLCGGWDSLRKGFRRPPRGGCCLELPPNVHVSPDPMIYDQYYLMSQGLAVTWDNPDILLSDMLGNPVTPDDLAADQDYQVTVRAWNGSYGAPAANLPIQLSFLSFGIGITSTPIGGAVTNLGVKGSTRCPAFVTIVWHTPAVPGHYCLQALLVWPDDANPANNLGQKNTQVRAMRSPATFTVAVQNQANVVRRFELEMDTYQLPRLPACTEEPAVQAATLKTEGRYAESRARWDAALRTQGYGMFPVSNHWTISIMPREFDLAPGKITSVVVAIEHVGLFAGTQAFNLHGFASPPTGPRQLVGGVTLNVQGS